MKRQWKKRMPILTLFAFLLGIIFLPGQGKTSYAAGTDAGGTREEAMTGAACP